MLLLHVSYYTEHKRSHNISRLTAGWAKCYFSLEFHGSFKETIYYILYDCVIIAEKKKLTYHFNFQVVNKDFYINKIIR